MFYVDYGNEEPRAISALQPLPPKFTELPAQAMAVQLHEITSKNLSLLSKEFVSLTSEMKLKLQCKAVEGKCCLTSKYHEFMLVASCFQFHLCSLLFAFNFIYAHWFLLSISLMLVAPFNFTYARSSLLSITLMLVAFCFLLHLCSLLLAFYYTYARCFLLHLCSLIFAFYYNYARFSLLSTTLMLVAFCFLLHLWSLLFAFYYTYARCSFQFHLCSLLCPSYYTVSLSLQVI